jgi:hypothetical protein
MYAYLICRLRTVRLEGSRRSLSTFGTRAVASYCRSRYCCSCGAAGRLTSRFGSAIFSLCDGRHFTRSRSRMRDSHLGG